MAYPPLDEILPHRPPMLLLDAMTLAEAQAVACTVAVRPDAPFVQDGKTSSLLAVEYFAQAVAALFAYKARGEGAPEFRGLLLGVRDLDLAVPHFHVGDVLEVTCREHWGSGPVAHFQCSLSRGPDRLATGAITVLRGDPSELAARPSAPELAARPSAPELAAPPSGPELAARPSGPELAARPSGPELAARPSAPEPAARPSAPGADPVEPTP